jgi:hypothetical protein
VAADRASAAVASDDSSFVTVDNYEYGYYWYFCQDGSIEFEAKLTGIVLTLAPDPDKAPRHATEIAPGRPIGVTRVHMEDDAGKSIHDGFKDSDGCPDADNDGDLIQVARLLPS